MNYAIFYQNYSYVVKRKDEAGAVSEVGKAATYDGAVHLCSVDSKGMPVLLTALTQT